MLMARRYTKPTKPTIFKMMVVRDTLVYDSENWSADQPFPVVSLFLCLESSFIGAVISVIWIKVYKTRASKKTTGLNEEKSPSSATENDKERESNVRLVNRDK